jgi:hypothetical protein
MTRVIEWDMQWQRETVRDDELFILQRGGQYMLAIKLGGRARRFSGVTYSRLSEARKDAERLGF